MTSAEKKIIADQILALATEAEAGYVDTDVLIRRLWKLGNELRNEAMEDATK